MSATSPEMIVKNRFLGFLIWQSIPSTAIFILFKTFISTITTSTSTSSSSSRNPLLSYAPSLITLLTFFTFHLSQLLFSASLSLVSSPHPHRPAYPFELILGLVRFLLVSDSSSASVPVDFRFRAKVSLSFVLFVAACAVSGSLGMVSMCWVKSSSFDVEWVIRGFGVGLLYGLVYVYKRRWVLEFPIIQRPPFFSFKMGLPSATTCAFALSGVAYLFSAVLGAILPDPFKRQVTVRKYIAEQIIFWIGSFAMFLCWELSHHLHRVLHTKRFTFAPPKGSAAAETNPSEHLLAALEERNGSSLLQYLAYLDLCMVCENNVDTWRRAAFFEETGETYKRVTAVCLRPLEELALKLAEGLESKVDKTSQLSNQLLSPADSRLESKHWEPLNNFQLCAWCARTVASLTAGSHTEDRCGVAQLSGSNADVISTLLSCLLAVETFMGKKTHLQSPSHLMGPAGIKWATSSTRRIEGAVGKKRGGPLHSKAYAVADVLRTSIYSIVSAFHDEMLSSAKAGLLEKDWIISGKPLFGTRELLLQKLRLFLDFRAS
ncbi:uncharacterized protein LOC132170957 [Corylus avellana]|uniref:uncharacterized protein LOC132170957 n=1 Tax=Corylus avellana TaxID=13451 RepID=UPI00286AE858|nr:uncharacterized protein LOC132170957 [Corylus avellana]